MKKDLKSLHIFYASHVQGNHSIQSKTWYNNHYLPLVEVCGKVTKFDFDLFPFALHQDETIPANKAFNEANRPKLEAELLRQIREAHKQNPIDIFFSYFASSYCSNAVIEEIKSMGILTVNWFCNASYQFYLVERIAKAFDYCLVPEKFRLADYKKAGANPIYCQEAANPNIYQYKKLPYQYDAAFVGGRYGDRYVQLKTLYNAGIDVHAWGENWGKKFESESEFGSGGSVTTDFIRSILKKKNIPPSNLHCFVSDEEMVSIFNQAKVNLGFAKVGNSHLEKEPIKQVRLRDFEVPMSGGFYLAEHSDELVECFTPDKEMVFFSSIEECRDKTKFYLKNEILRETIRLAGHQKAIAEHSWQKRFKDVFEIILNS